MKTIPVLINIGDTRYNKIVEEAKKNNTDVSFMIRHIVDKYFDADTPEIMSCKYGEVVK